MTGGCRRRSPAGRARRFCACVARPRTTPANFTPPPTSNGALCRTCVASARSRKRIRFGHQCRKWIVCRTSTACVNSTRVRAICIVLGDGGRFAASEPDRQRDPGVNSILDLSRVSGEHQPVRSRLWWRGETDDNVGRPSASERTAISPPLRPTSFYTTGSSSPSLRTTRSMTAGFVGTGHLTRYPHVG